MSAKNKTYNVNDLTVLEGLEAVRMRPGMYIGTTGPSGLHHLLWEIVDNSIDEIANGYGTTLSVTLNRDGSVTCEDNGRGIPVEIHGKLKISGIEMVFTKLHAGGKFSDGNYQYSGGLHGVGASVTNALSRWLKVSVFKPGKVYEMSFKAEDKRGGVKSGVVDMPLSEKPFKGKKVGTEVTFLPDERVFLDATFSYDTIKKRLRELAFLNKGSKISLIDLRGEEPKEASYQFDKGLGDYISYITKNKSQLYQNPITMSGEKDGIYAEFAIQHTDEYTDNIYSFVNNIPTTEGGTHETGFKSGLTKALNDYARKVGVLKEKDQNFAGEDFRVGIHAVISIKMKNVQFEGQTKTKLGNPEAKSAIESIITSELLTYASSRGSGVVLDTVMKKALNSQKERMQIKKAKDIARAKNALDISYLVGKLSSCTGRKSEQNELFIVEGDSAGGTAKQGRDRRYQAILPLKGKPLNVERKKIDQVLENEEIRTIISALGTSLGEDFNIDNLKYHKIIILSDADQDGLHIRCILLTFFYRYMRDLIKSGKIYIGKPPLYKVERGSFLEYCYTEEELKLASKRAGKGYKVQRYKGLGEMNASQLWDTTLDPDKRSLIQVTIEDAAEAEILVTTLMGDKVDDRKAYIQEHSNFNKVDNFQKITGEDQ